MVDSINTPNPIKQQITENLPGLMSRTGKSKKRTANSKLRKNNQVRLIRAESFQYKIRSKRSKENLLEQGLIDFCSSKSTRARSNRPCSSRFSLLLFDLILYWKLSALI